MRSVHDDDTDAAASPGDRLDLVAGAMQQDIRLGTADPQPADMQAIEKFRQDRTLEPDLEPIGVELQPKARLHQREDGGAGPGLRRAGYRIRRRRGVPAREAAEQFWQAARFPIG